MITALVAAAAFALPNPTLTPGATNPAVTQATIRDTICRHGWTVTVRNVPRAERRAVLAEYGNPQHVVIDHLIALSLGGANETANLWPQDTAEAKKKDVVEDHLRRQVCAGMVTLEAAQNVLATDWRQGAAL